MDIKTGYHAVYEENYFTGIEMAVKYKFDFVQFDLGVPVYYLHNLSDSKFYDIKRYAEAMGVEITFHAPADNIGLFYDYPKVRKGVLDEFKQMLETANFIGARHMTFHAGTCSMFNKSGEKTNVTLADYYENLLYENLSKLISYSGNVLICVENNGFMNLERKALQRLIDEEKQLYLTLDIAKLYKSADNIIEDDLAFFKKNSEYIREIHIHDKNDRFGSHQTVGSGYVDFGLFKPFFNKNTYLNFEVRPVTAANQSKEILFSGVI